MLRVSSSSFLLLYVLILIHVGHSFVLPLFSTPVARPTSTRRARQPPKKTKSEIAWDQRFDDLVAFQKRYGHLNVPQRPTSKIPGDYSRLSNFCRNARSQYRYRMDPDKQHLSFLTEDRIRRLERLGFVWNTHRQSWNQRYKELERFHERHGHCDVPAAWDADPGLGSWVVLQRQKYRAQERSYAGPKMKKLSKTQIQLLDDLGFRWNPQQEVWWSLYDELRDFLKEHGHLRATVSTNRRLALWLAHQRRYCREYVVSAQLEGHADVHVSGLDKDRIEALRSIGFCWLPPPGSITETPPDDIFEGYLGATPTTK